MQQQRHLMDKFDGVNRLASRPAARTAAECHLFPLINGGCARPSCSGPASGAPRLLAGAAAGPQLAGPSCWAGSGAQLAAVGRGGAVYGSRARAIWCAGRGPAGRHRDAWPWTESRARICGNRRQLTRRRALLARAIGDVHSTAAEEGRRARALRASNASE